MSKYIYFWCCLSNSYCRFIAGRKSGWVQVSSFLAAFVGPAQGPRIDVPPPTTVTGSLPCIEGCTDKVCRVLPHGIWNRSCITNWNDRQLSKDGFHWENVKHLTVRLALIHDTGTAIQKPSCAKTTKIRILYNSLEEFSIIQYRVELHHTPTARTQTRSRVA